jgi:biuret amidohydrolase
MPLDLRSLVDPAHTVLVTQECQRGVIGSPSVLPALADAAASSGMIDSLARLAKAARAAGVPVVHCTAARRADGRGSSHNARLFRGVDKAEIDLAPGTDATQVVPELDVQPEDIVLVRLHGLGPMGGTDLDAVLRNLGARTIVGVGVSLNIGMTNFAMDAVNAGYQMVIPRDAVVGVPPSYGEAILENTLSLIATVPTTDDVVTAWAR